MSQECRTKVIGNQAWPRQSPAEGAAGMDFPPGLVLGTARAEGQGDPAWELPGVYLGQDEFICWVCLETLPSPYRYPQYPWFSLSPQWEAILQGVCRRRTTKGLAKAQIPYNCFYKSSLLFPPASYLGPPGEESVTELSWPCMLTRPARQPLSSLLEAMDGQTNGRAASQAGRAGEGTHSLGQ